MAFVAEKAWSNIWRDTDKLNVIESCSAHQILQNFTLGKKGFSELSTITASSVKFLKQWRLPLDGCQMYAVKYGKKDENVLSVDLKHSDARIHLN